MTDKQLTADEYRQLIATKLPGRRLDNEITITSSLGRVFMLLDEQWPREKPIRQKIRILPGAKDSLWYAPLLDRLQKLSAAPLPHVAVPRDFGLLENGDFYIITDDLRFNASDHLVGNMRLSTDSMLALVEQIVEGLSSLHQQNIYHGGLRTQQFFLDRMPDSRNHDTAWIAGTCVAGLPYWSEGAFPDPEGRKYYPPEWQGKADAPTASADLYALGVSVAEMLEGPEANPQRPAKAKNYQPLSERYSWWNWRQARSRARDFCIPWVKERSRSPRVLGRLLRCLLMERDVENAVVLLDRLRRWQRQADRSLWQWRSGLLFVVLIVVWATYWARVGNLEQTIAANSSRDDETQTKLRKLIEQNEDFSRERNGLRQEITDLRKLLPPSRETLNKEATKMWSGWEKESPDFDSLMKKVSDFASSPGNGHGRDETVKTVRDWAKAVRESHAKFQPWNLPSRASYFGLYPLYLEVRLTPWDEVKRQGFDRRLGALGEAATDWRKWAEDDGLHFNDLYVRLASTPNPDAKDILRSWLDETNARKQWQVQLISGHAPPGWGTARTFAWAIDNGTWQKQDNLDWISGESHVYPASTTFRFERSPNHTIRFALRQTGKISDSTMVDSQVIGGPLAVWQINAHGSIAEEGRSLEFEIVDCPGPPRKKELLNALRPGQ